MTQSKSENQAHLGDRLLPFYAGLAAACLSLVSLTMTTAQMAIALSAVLFFATYLGLNALRFPKMNAEFLKRNAANEDVPVAFIFIITGMAIVISIGSLFFLINNGDSATLPALFVSLGSVGLGWVAVHTMAALHYAHVFWQPDDTVPPDTRHRVRRGLIFPETPEPTITDFLYFAFVIGMTAQTSDVVITSTAIRKLNLAHAVVSFFFNTVLVAAAVNVAVSLHVAPH